MKLVYHGHLQRYAKLYKEMKGHYNHDKNTFHLPRQYMSVTDFRICFKGHGGETRFN